MWISANPLPVNHFPELANKLALQGQKTKPIVWTIELSFKGKRNADVYTDGWPEFTTVLVERVKPKLCDEGLLLFTTDTNRCTDFLLTYVSDFEYKWFGALLPEASDALIDVLQKKGIKYNINKGFGLFCMNKEWKPNKDLSLPPGYHESVLKNTDAAMVVDKWIYAAPGTEEYISFIIDNFHTMCIRDDNGVLVGWLLHQTIGMLGMLHVLDGHRRKGLGKYLVQKLSERILQDGSDPFLFIQKENKQSIELHKQCGYEATGDICSWLNIFNKHSEQ